MNNITLHLLIFFLGNILALFIPASTFYLISLEKRFSYQNHLLSFLNKNKKTKKLYQLTVSIIASGLIIYFILIRKLMDKYLNNTSTILLLASSITLLSSVFFTYNFKKKNFNKIMHYITISMFISGFGLGIIFLHIELLKINIIIAITGLILTFINILFSGIYFASVKKLNSILEIIIMFFFSWWLLFFSTAQLFLFFQI